MRRVRIGAYDQLPRQCVAFEHYRMTNAFRALAVRQLPVQPDAALFGKILLLQLELRRQVEQTHLALLLREHFVQKRQVVAEENDRRGIVHRSIASRQLIEEDGCHGRDVFMAEAQIGASESGVSRLHSLDAWLFFFNPVSVNTASRANHVAGENFLRQRHGTLLVLNRRQEDFSLHAGHVEIEEPSMLDNLARDLVFALRELGKRDFLPGADLVDQRKINRSQHTQVLAILLVNALDVLGDDDLYARAKLCVRRLLAAGALAPALAADRGHKPALFHIAALDGCFTATLQAGVGKLAQGFVEEKADVSRSDLISGDVVAQLGVIGGILRIPGQVLARQLTPDQFRVFGEEKNAPFQANLVGPLLDFSLQQRADQNDSFAGPASPSATLIMQRSSNCNANSRSLLFAIEGTRVNPGPGLGSSGAQTRVGGARRCT